jgi:hypothetical protein
MEQQIINLLQCKKHQFEMLVFEHYFLWCEIHSFSEGDLQRIMANKKIAHWFQIEYRKHQQTFINLVIPYKNYCTKEDMERIYKQEVMAIRNYYPKSLINSVRHSKYSIHGSTPNTN